MRPSYNVKFITWGFFLGMFLAISLETGLLEIWHSLGKPPEEISRLIGSSGEAVYIQTKSGNTYKYGFLIFEHQPVSPVWELETSNEYRLYSPATDTDYFIIIPPLLWIKQSLTINDSLSLLKKVVSENLSLPLTIRSGCGAISAQAWGLFFYQSYR